MIPKNIKNRLKGIRKIYYFLFKHNSIKCNRNNLIKYGYNTILKDCGIKVEGKNNKIIFGDNCNLCGLRMLIVGDNNLITFGDNTTVNASKIQPTVINAVGGKTISIGKGSLFSNNIEIHTSDYHGIYDKDGKRLNYDKDIIIGNNVWIGLGCKILKGTIIPDGCVVGAGSLVSGIYEEKNAILAGNPAKIIKQNIIWNDARKDKISI